MTAIWSPENRYRKWLDIEILACEAMAETGGNPPASLKNIREKAGFDVSRIDEIEKTTKHDVIAFLTSVTEKVGKDGRFIHMGLTSSDILDTSLALLLREAADILIEDLDGLLAALKKKAFDYKNTLMIGRIARDPCGTDHLRPEDGALVRRDGEKPGEDDPGQRDDQYGKTLRGGGDILLHRSKYRDLCLQKTGVETGPCLLTDHPEGPPCRIFHHPGHHRLFPG